MNVLSQKTTGIIFDLAYTQMLDARRDAFRLGQLAVVERLTDMRNQFRHEFSVMEDAFLSGGQVFDEVTFSETLSSLIDQLRRQYVISEDDPDGIVDRVLANISMSTEVNLTVDMDTLLPLTCDEATADQRAANGCDDVAQQNARIINSFGYFSRRLEDAIIDSSIPFIRSDADLVEFSDRMLELSDAISSQLMENYLRQMLEADDPKPIDITPMREATRVVFQKFEDANSFVTMPINFDAHFPTERSAYLRIRDAGDMLDHSSINRMD